MTDYIDQVFGAHGLISKRFDGYAPRSGQIALAREIDSMISLSEHLINEAPTGTGKSLAYSVPATWHAANNGRRVTIVTANIALQEQIVRKDLPMLKEILPWEFSFALAKGRSNYLCLDQYERNKDKLPDGAFGFVEEWVEKTQEGSFSDLADLIRVTGDIRSLLTVESSECTGARCEYYGAEFVCAQCGSRKKGGASKVHECCDEDMQRSSDPSCYVERAKMRIWNSNIVVTNYHMLFADIMVRQMTEGMASVLPPFDVLVMDEAHCAPEIARNFMGDEVTRHSFRKVLAGIPKLSFNSPRAKAEVLIDSFFEALTRWGKTSDAKPRYTSPVALDWEGLRDAIRDVQKWYESGEDTIEGDTLDLFADEKNKPRKRRKLSERDRETYIGRCERLLDRFTALCIARDQERYVYYVDYDSNGYSSLRSKLITPGPMMRSMLFETVGAAIMTSATLTVENRFDHVIKESGIPSPTELIVQSPFNLREQAALIVDASMPDPRDKDWPSEVPIRCEQIVRMAKGRTLILCTSNRMKDAVYERLQSAGLPYNIMVQWAPHERTRLIEEFKRDTSSVLIGTESFWAGVDIPGESLSCLVIDRIPFPTPDDPVLAAIADRDKKWFWRYSVPSAAIKFKQGFGRLIRSVNDHGVAVCLDTRLIKMGYGKTLIKSLGPIKAYKDLEMLPRLLGTETEDVGIAAV